MLDQDSNAPEPKAEDTATWVGPSGAGALEQQPRKGRSVANRPGVSPFGNAVDMSPDDLSDGWTQPAPSPWSIEEISPDGTLVQRIEGLTRKTWKFNDYSKDRVQVALSSDGRPINADVQLWIGPDWTPFSLKAYSENGRARPIQTLIGTRNMAAVIEVMNIGESEFPVNAAANYARGPMSTLAEDIPDSMEGEKVDGGALRSFPLDRACKLLEVVLKTDGRQLNARVELLNGPNNAKQTIEVFTQNGDIGSLCMAFQTPDAGSVIRIVNLATLEFPCYIYLKGNA